MRNPGISSKWVLRLKKVLALTLAASFVFPPGMSTRLIGSGSPSAYAASETALSPESVLEESPEAKAKRLAEKAKRVANEAKTLARYEESATRIGQAFEGQAVTDPLDPYQISLQVVEKLKKPGAIPHKQIHVRLVTTSGAERGRVNRADHTAKMGYAEEKLLPYAASGGRVELWYQDTLIQSLNVDAKSVGFLGDYLVFIKKDQFVPLDPGPYGIQVVHFVDLKYFDRAIGRNELPVFRMGLKTDGPVSALSAHGDVLVAGSGEITPAALKKFSEVQQWGFNLAVAMVDPAFQSVHGAASEAFLQTLDAAFQYAGESNDLAATQALTVDQEIYLADLAQGIAGSLNATQAATSITPKTLLAESEAIEKKILADETRALVTQEAARLEADSQVLAELGVPQAMRERLQQHMIEARKAQSSQTTASAIAAQIKAGRTVRARLGEVILAASLPKPTEAGTIKNALALFASGAKRLATGNNVAGSETTNPALSDAREGVAQIAAHPWARAGAAVVAAAFLGTYYPTETVGYIAEGLSAAAQIAEASAGYVGNLVFTYGKTTAQAAVNMSEAIRHPVATYQYYTSPENLPHLAEGLGALGLNALMVVGIPHLTVNAAALAVDLYRKGFGLTTAVPSAPEGETSGARLQRLITAIPSVVSAPSISPSIVS
ncbi:MAG: hypothetical protein AAB425_14145, partial [Bdellovibrionota bacterium]